MNMFFKLPSNFNKIITSLNYLHSFKNKITYFKIKIPQINENQ